MDAIERLISAERTIGVVYALIVLSVGILLSRFVSRGVGRLVARRSTPQTALIARRLASWAILAITVLWALDELGFDLKVLLGAAGVLTVAIGFASQTSASNFISGLFLMGERPFVVGDVIKVGDITGEVISIDLISVKLRTFDNLAVRIPNETMIKSNVTTMTHYPIRRYDLQLGVAYKEDLAVVREVLLEVASRNPVCLDEPEPIIIFLGFGDSALQIQFSVWALRENFLTLRNTLSEEVKKALDARGIEIPFPHRTLYAGSRTEALPVRLVADEAEPK